MDRLIIKPKTLGIVVLLCSMVWMSSAVATDLHGPNTYCPVCHLSLIPFLKISVPVVGTPAVLIARLALHRDSAHARTDYYASGISRAPPLHS